MGGDFHFSDRQKEKEVPKHLFPDSRRRVDQPRHEPGRYFVRAVLVPGVVEVEPQVHL